MFDAEAKEYGEERAYRRIAAAVIARAVDDFRLVRAGEEIEVRANGTGGRWFDNLPYPVFYFRQNIQTTDPKEELNLFFKSDDFKFYASALKIRITRKMIVRKRKFVKLEVEANGHKD